MTGLQKLGTNVTRQGLIDTINKFKSFSAHGITPGIDWTIAHHDSTKGDSCRAFVKIENGKFVPEFGTPGKPFVCIPGNAKSIDEAVIRGPNPDKL